MWSSNVLSAGVEVKFESVRQELKSSNRLRLELGNKVNKTSYELAR